METLELSERLAEEVAQQPQGLDAVNEAAKTGDLLGALKYFIPPDRVTGLAGANEVSGNVDVFIARVQAMTKKV